MWNDLDLRPGLAGLLGLAGCLLGLVGWLRAGRALRELAAVRELLAERVAAGASAGAAGIGRAAAQGEALNAKVAPGEALNAKVAPGEALNAQVAPPAPPLGAPNPVAASVAGKRFDIEQVLTQRWGVWLGAAALLLAGVFLVRTAVEQGWLGPAPRCASAGMFGLALIGGAEWARRPAAAQSAGSPNPMGDAATPGLAAGGVGVVFAAAYGAGPLYGLVPDWMAFALLGAAGLAGLLLSLRFGWLVAAVGLAASFVTPALVSTADPSLPGLFGYLLFVSAASWAVVRWTAWVWLGWAASAGGAAWVGWVAATLAGAGPGVWAAGLFVPAAAALSLALLPEAALTRVEGQRFSWGPMLLLGLVALMLLSVTRSEWVRAGVLLLAPVAMAKAWRAPVLARVPLLSAGLCVASVLVWGVNGPQTTGHSMGFDALLPRVWTLEKMLWPFIGVPVLIAAGHAAVGLAGERHQPRPVPWAALVAAVPVLVLAAAYAVAGHLAVHWPWALAAAALAAGLVGAATVAMPDQLNGRARAGTHAAGAVAALALGCAILLEDAWLTVAIALLLPGLAWIEGAADLRPLRQVALAVAATVLVRLGFNPWVAGYDLGATPVLNGLLVAYGIPAVCFGASARVFWRRGDDLLVAVLEAGAIAFAALLVVLEIHHASTGGVLDSFPMDFTDWAWEDAALWLMAAALGSLAGRSGRGVQRAGARVLGALALAGGAVLLVLNPYWASKLDDNPIFSALIPAYLLPAVLATLMVRGGAKPRRLFGSYAYAAALLFVSLQVRQAFHPGMTSFWTPVEDAELWAVSGAWLLLALVLLGSGMALRWRGLRLGGLLTVLLVAGKVFLVDMAGLDGLWRVLSFGGLGLSLIGLAAVYRRFAGPEGAGSGRGEGTGVGV